MNRYTAGYLRGGAESVTWVATDSNAAADLCQQGIIERALPNIDRTNEIVTVTDSRLEIRHFFFSDHLHGIGLAHRKVTHYYQAADGADEYEGTHIAAIVAGSLDCLQTIGSPR
jgi:hypothetical protein